MPIASVRTGDEWSSSSSFSRRPACRRCRFRATLLAIVSRSQPVTGGPSERWLDDVVDHLHAHVFERVTLAELAGVGGVHRTHLVRSFRARFGVSVGAYVRRMRIEWAAEALVARQASIAEIAAQAGFADQSHFTRTFVQHVGLPPGRYRAAARAAGHH